MIAVKFLPVLAFLTLVSGEECEDSFTFVNGSCYKWFNQKVTGDVARSMCQSEGAYLASVKNSQTQDYIASVMEDRGWGRVWIGLRETLVPWRWVTDGAPVYHMGCFNTTERTQQLDALLDDSPDVIPGSCTSTCIQAGYSYAGVMLIENTTVECRCGNDFNPIYDDIVRCHENCLANRLTVCGDNNGGMWVINLKASQTANLWYYNQPNDAPNYQTCISLHSDRRYRWGDEGCATTSVDNLDNHHICQYNIAEESCVGDGKYWIDDHCISVHNETALTWFQARTDCMGRAADLVKIDSTTFQNALVDSVLNGTNSLWWTSATSSKWTWPDGSELEYSNFASGNPDNSNQHCVNLYKASTDIPYQWEDARCSGPTYRFVCEQLIPTTTVSVTTESAMKTTVGMTQATTDTVLSFSATTEVSNTPGYDAMISTEIPTNSSYLPTTSNSLSVATTQTSSPFAQNSTATTSTMSLTTTTTPSTNGSLSSMTTNPSTTSSTTTTSSVKSTTTATTTVTSTITRPNNRKTSTLSTATPSGANKLAFNGYISTMITGSYCILKLYSDKHI